MACPRCRLRLNISLKRKQTTLPSGRAFHSTPRNSRLGAATYAQEWQTGTYHFNKANTKTLPVAASHTDNLLQAYATQQKRRGAGGSPSSEAYKLMLKNSIAAQRRKTDRVFISKSTAKDFGDKVVVSAFVFDGDEAAAREEERRKKALAGVKAEREEGRRRQGQGQARRRGPGGPGAGGAGGNVRRGMPGTAGARRLGGTGASGAASGTGYRTLRFGGAGGPTRP